MLLVKARAQGEDRIVLDKHQDVFSSCQDLVL